MHNVKVQFSIRIVMVIILNKEIYVHHGDDTYRNLGAFFSTSEEPVFLIRGYKYLLILYGYY